MVKPDPEAWRRRAVCRDLATEIFYPSMEHDDGRPKRETSRSYKEARVICAECPVKTQCLEYALENNEPTGMWGGLTRPERAKLQRARRQATKSASNV